MLREGEIIVDSFAGGGGASLGIETALGRSVDIAINHDAEAIALHAANHPLTQHLQNNVWQVDPAEAINKRPVGLLWASPDCKHFSKAKGGKPVARNIRDLAWVVIVWAKRARPRVIMLENVEEFRDWGPLITREDGKEVPDRERRGETFKEWVGELKKLGYRVEHRELRACDYGAPTIRKRLFLIARSDGVPIRWPAPTHGAPGDPDVAAGRKKPWRTAAEIIDWSLPCPSIFLTREEGRAIGCNRPLADATMARIAKGVRRYVLEAVKPFIVCITHQGPDTRVENVEEPLRTVTGAHRGEKALVVPTIIQCGYGEREGQEPRVPGCEKPLGTVVAGGVKHAVVAPVIVRTDMASGSPRNGVHGPEEPVRTMTSAGSFAVTAATLVGCGGRAGQSRPRGVDEPMATQTAKADGCVAAVHLQRQFGASVGSDAEDPVGTVTPGGGGKTAVVAAHLTKFRKNSIGSSLDAPVHTVTANSFIERPGGAPPIGVVAAYLAQHNTDMVGHPAEAPVSTIVQKGCTQAVVSAGLVNMKGSDQRGCDVEQPSPAVCAQGTHIAEVRAFLLKYYGSAIGQAADDPAHTATAKARLGLVLVEGEPYQIVDIGMRMLKARELFRAQGFPDSYKIDPMIGGKTLSVTAQIRMCGNSVSPVMSEALARANFLAGDEPRRDDDEISDAPLFEAAE